MLFDPDWSNVLYFVIGWVSPNNMLLGLIIWSDPFQITFDIVGPNNMNYMGPLPITAPLGRYMTITFVIWGRRLK